MTGLIGVFLGWSIRSAFLVLLALGISGICRTAPAAVRHIVWRSALAGTLVILCATLWAPKLEVALPFASHIQNPDVARQIVPIMSTDVAAEAQVRSTAKSVMVEPAKANPARGIIGDASVWSLALIAYIVGIAWVIARWIASVLAIRRICRLAQPVDGLPDTVRARTLELRVPFTFGWHRPVIVLPADSVTWTSDRLEAVLLHERAHMKRRDWIWQTAATVNAAIQWFNPAAWLLASELRATAEESADNEVLEAGMAPSIYAAELIELASNRSTPSLAVMDMARHGRTSVRLRAILACGRNRKPAGLRHALGTAAGFGLVGIALATCTVAPPKIAFSPRLDSMPQAAAPQNPESETTFSNGTLPRILYIGPATSSNLPTWRADGSPTGPDEPLKHGSTYSTDAPGKGKRILRICFEFLNFPESERSNLGQGPLFRPAKLGGVLNGGGGMSMGGNLECDYSFTVPAKWKTADFEVALGRGAFHPVAESVGGKGNLDIKIAPLAATRRSGASGKPDKVERINQSSVTFILPAKLDKRDWRLVAYDAKNQPLRIMMGFGGMDFPGEKPRTWHATSLEDPSSIARLVLEARDYEWVKIPDVHLYANESTSKLAAMPAKVERHAAHSVIRPMKPVAIPQDVPLPAPDSEAKFSNGAITKIVYIGSGNSTELPVWGPDGKPSDDSEALVINNQYASFSSPKGKRSVRVCFDISDLPPGDLENQSQQALFRPAKLNGIPFTGGGFSGYGWLHCSLTFQVPSSWKTGDLEVPLGTGEFHTVAENESGKGNLQVRITPKESTRTTYAAGKITDTSLSTSSILTFTVPPALDKGEWRLLVYDSDGKAVPINVWSSIGRIPGEPEGTHHAGCQEDPKNLAKFVLVARDYEWLKLRNLHLYPDRSKAAH